MIKDYKDVLKLFDAILNGEANEEDIRNYNSWCRAFQERGIPVPNLDEMKAEMLTEIRKQIRQRRRVDRLRMWTKVAAAACVVLILGLGGYFLIRRPQPFKMSFGQSNDVAPGYNKAILSRTSRN